MRDFYELVILSSRIAIQGNRFSLNTIKTLYFSFSYNIGGYFSQSREPEYPTHNRRILIILEVFENIVSHEVGIPYSCDTYLKSKLRLLGANYRSSKFSDAISFK